MGSCQLVSATLNDTQVTSFNSLRIALRSNSPLLQTSQHSTDVSGKQQLSISLRWVGTAFDVHEDFVDLYETNHGADAKTITKMRMDAQVRFTDEQPSRPRTRECISNVWQQHQWCIHTNQSNGKRCRVHPLLRTLPESCLTRCNSFVHTNQGCLGLVYFVKASPLRSRVFD